MLLKSETVSLINSYCTMNISDSKGSSTTVDTLSMDTAIGVFILLFYVTVFITSIIGNSTILAICYKSGKRLQAPAVNRGASESSRGQFFNHYVANLAIADLLFTLLTIGDASYAILQSWPAGDALCKLQGCLVETCYSASILTLIAISRERMKAVSGLQLKSQLQKAKERKITSVVVWISAVTLCSPLLYAYREHKTPENRLLCENIAWGYLGRRVFYTFAAAVLFLLPLVVMSWTYLKINREFKNHVSPNRQRSSAVGSVMARQRKASRMLSAVTLVFFVLWTPFIVLRTLMYFDLYHGYIMWKLSQLAIMASAATNPFIYSFYSTHFRALVKRVITCRCSTVFLDGSSQGEFTNSVV